MNKNTVFHIPLYSRSIMRHKSSAAQGGIAVHKRPSPDVELIVMIMKLVSWNVNGFRAICGKPDWSWFGSTNADVVALQETKVDPVLVPPEVREPEGWQAHWLGSRIKKGYSGVAVFTRLPALRSDAELPDPRFEGEGRLLHLEFPAFHFFNVYFPNGTRDDERLAYKMGYYEAFLAHAETLRKEKPIVVCGDFNTAHRPIDLARPRENEDHSGFLPLERAWMDRFAEAGYVDTFRHVHGDVPGMYSWWSYKQRARVKNVGWRIDYFFVSKELAPAVRDAWIELEVMGSDHCPVGLALEVGEKV